MTFANKREAVILMSALVPTTGHRDLIKFGLSLPVAQVTVILGYLPGEPVTAEERRDALVEAVGLYGDAERRLRFILMDESDAPNQALKAADVTLFFQRWATLIEELVEVEQTGRDLCLVGSEPYCVPQAAALGVPYIPFDIDRHMNAAQGRKVRASMVDHWGLLTSDMRRKFGVTATLFGQDSVGKTTYSQRLGSLPLVQGIAEYARPYLEAVGEELTEEKMSAIWQGQNAWQQLAGEHEQAPMLVQDTDLFTTIGYYRVNKLKVPAGLVEDAVGGMSDVYFLLPDADVPFVPDALRYAGDVRETTREFWVELAEEFHLPVVMVPEGTLQEKTRFMQDVLYQELRRKHAPVEGFQRTNIDPDPV